MKKWTTDTMPPAPFVLTAAMFVLLSCSGYEGVVFPVDRWYWPCTWKSDLERKSSPQSVQVKARETLTKGENTCEHVCLQMCTVHVSACLTVLSVTSVWCDCTSVYMCWKVWWALATIACTIQRVHVGVCVCVWARQKWKAGVPSVVV